jgi:hypothetical protein
LACTRLIRVHAPDSMFNSPGDSAKKLATPLLTLKALPLTETLWRRASVALMFACKHTARTTGPSVSQANASMISPAVGAHCWERHGEHVHP